MAHVKRGTTRLARRRSLLAKTKGFTGRRKNTRRIALQAADRAGQAAYRARRLKKRTMRALWIQRINAAARQAGMPYSQFIASLKSAGIALDRKMLSELAARDSASFARLLDSVRR